MDLLRLPAVLVATTKRNSTNFNETAGQTLKIVLVDRSDQGPMSRIVETACALYRRQSPDCVYEYVGLAAIKSGSCLATTDEGIVLVAVEEPDLSARKGGETGVRVAAESMAVAQQLASCAHRPRVFLVRRSDASGFSGMDSAAAVISRIAGILDDRLLLYDSTLPRIVKHSVMDARYWWTLIIGRAAIQLQALKSMLNEWEERLGGDGTMDPACWRAAMALAQLDKLSPLRDGMGERYSFVKLAQTLNLRQAVTSFRLSESDLRKVLSMLADLWIAASEDRSQRVNLPQRARENGFPRNQPVVAGLSDTQLPKRLYDACKALVVLKREELHDDTPFLLVRIPLTQIVRLKKQI